MPCEYARTTAVRIRHQVSCWAAQQSRLLSMYHAELHSCLGISRSFLQICAEVSGASKFEYSISQISKHPENALAESNSTLQSSRGVSKHLEVLRKCWWGHLECLGGLRVVSWPIYNLLMQLVHRSAAIAATEDMIQDVHLNMVCKTKSCKNQKQHAIRCE